MVIDKYYFLGTSDVEGSPFAYTEDESIIAHDLIPKLKPLDRVPFSLRVKNVELVDNKVVTKDISSSTMVWRDYLPNNLAWTLMSEKMKKIINDNLTGNEGLVWMAVNVIAGIEAKEYFIAKFEKQLDVLNTEKTLFVKGTSHVIKPVFAIEKIRAYGVFYKPTQFWTIQTNIYVSQTIRNSLLRQGIKGISFNEVTVA